VRVIRDRQTSKQVLRSHFDSSDPQVEQSRHFGFLRFATLQQAEDFMERNYPLLYLYGKGEEGGADAVKVHIAFSRERKGPLERDEPDWICKMVCGSNLCLLLITYCCSATSTISLPDFVAFDARLSKQVRIHTNRCKLY
jgi:hypothetical protein